VFYSIFYSDDISLHVSLTLRIIRNGSSYQV